MSNKSIPSVNSIQIGQLKQSVDAILEKSDKITYLGFCTPGTTGTDQEGWSILKIEETFPGAVDNVIAYKWANGQCYFDLIFDDCETYDYSFKSF